MTKEVKVKNAIPVLGGMALGIQIFIDLILLQD